MIGEFLFSFSGLIAVLLVIAAVWLKKRGFRQNLVSALLLVAILAMASALKG